jgi:hypothetical protein
MCPFHVDTRHFTQSTLFSPSDCFLSKQNSSTVHVNTSIPDLYLTELVSVNTIQVIPFLTDFDILDLLGRIRPQYSRDRDLVQLWSDSLRFISHGTRQKLRYPRPFTSNRRRLFRLRSQVCDEHHRYR